jgi:DNA-binding MarR family transcriptional regulator
VARDRDGAAALAPVARTYELDDQIGFLLRKAHQHATTVFTRVAGDYRVTPPQLAVIATLSKHGEISQSRLGQEIAMDPATLFGVVQRMAKGGVVEVRSDPLDARRRLVRLSRDGEVLAQDLLAVGLQVSEAILEGLSAAERDQLVALLKRLVDREG